MVACWILRVALLGTLLLAEQAGAICLPVPHYLYVGDTATDANCTDNDIQSAIDQVVCPDTSIIITDEHAYTSQALVVSNKSLTLIGADPGVGCGSQVASCDPSLGCGGGGGVPPAPAITVHGDGSDSVLFVYGTSSVTLQSIELTGGGGSQGGGILFGGTGSLTLVDSSIIGNTAVEGGAIYLAGLGGTATLTLGAGTIIEENTANVDGGGIYLGDATRLLALAPYTFIGYNHAPSGYGGGLMIAGTQAQAEIGSPGYNGAPVIEFNDADAGGGIAVVAPDTSNGGYNAEARLFATDPNNPAAIFSNSAIEGGGGIFIKPGFDASAGYPVGASFCAAGFRIDGNVAPEGAAILASAVTGTINDYGAEVGLNSQQCHDSNYAATLASLGAVDCASGVSCNTVNDNGSLSLTGGATILVNTGDFRAARFLMRHNTGGYAIQLFDALTGSGPSTCVLADNTEAGELIRADNTTLVIDSCTLANNTIGGASVIYDSAPSGTTGALIDSIVDQPGVVTLNAGAPVTGSYVLSNDVSTISGATQGAPTFVNAAGGDYHLQLASLGIDFAPSALGTPDVDLDGLGRVYDIPTVVNVHGPIDLGAYERHPSCYRSDTLLCDGFDGAY